MSRARRVERRGGLFAFGAARYIGAMAWTVQKLIDERMTLHAYCHNHRCHHNQKLDLETLKARLGPDSPAMADDLIPKLKCSKCGGKQLGITYSPDTTPTGKYGSYRQVKEGR